MKTKLILTSAIIVFATLAFTIAMDLPGKWTGNITTPNGAIPVTYMFKVDGQKLTGTITGPQGTTDIDSGVYKDSMLSFSFTGMGGTVIHQMGKFYGDSVIIDFSIMDHPVHLKLSRAN